MRVALVTSNGFPEPHWRDADSPAVAAQLLRLGVEVDTPAWDAEGAIDWRRYDALVLQSPWSMWQRLAEFGRWIEQRVHEGAHLLNPADVVALGSDKRYLIGLAAAGIAVVPSAIIDDAGDRSPSHLRDELLASFPAAVSPRRTAVVKPLAAGGSLGAREFAIGAVDDMAAYVRAMNGAGVAAMVQPYLHAIDVHRELGVLTLDDDISHAITKAPILRPDDEHRAFHPDPRPYETLSDAQRTVIRRTYDGMLGLLPAGAPRPLSVRLDFVIDPSAESGLVLLEIEMVAPVKFFALFPRECERYARSIADRTAAGTAAKTAGWTVGGSADGSSVRGGGSSGTPAG